MEIVLKIELKNVNMGRKEKRLEKQKTEIKTKNLSEGNEKRMKTNFKECFIEIVCMYNT